MILDIPDPEPVRWFIGLDLGQAADFTALAALERQPSGGLDLRHLDRVRGVSYPKVVENVVRLLALPDLRGAALAVDQTGVGRAVLDMLRAALPNTNRVLGVTITSGLRVTAGDPDCVNLPKKDLVTTAQVLFQSGRLKVARELALADVLVRELLAFKVRITTHANETFSSDWREGQHDDLVFALALAGWLAEHEVEPYTGPLSHNSWAPWPGDASCEGQCQEPPFLQRVADDLPDLRRFIEGED
jgi:hypothetical protein